MKAKSTEKTRRWRRIATLTVCCVIVVGPPVSAELIWWDGTRTPGDTPPGKLLSDNEDYWGEVVLTGDAHAGYAERQLVPQPLWEDHLMDFMSFELMQLMGARHGMQFIKGIIACLI